MKKKILLVAGAIVLLLAVGAILQAIRQMQTVAQVEREWQTATVQQVRDLGTTRSLTILPLFEEATARNDVDIEHGVSYLIKTDHQNILLDVGATPQRLQHNMQVLGVSASDIDTLVITHVHPDHVGGVKAWWTNTLVPGDPPLNLQGKRVYVPMPVSNVALHPIVVTQPLKIADGIATIGTISFAEAFPLALKSPRNTEQVLAVNVEGKGIVLITGCGHPTVERIVARAQATFDEPIIGIVGGLHYEGLTRDQVQPRIAAVQALNPQLVAVSPHDSSPEALQAFRAAFPGVSQDIKVGRPISLEDR
jgi:7,8-dihydropterin-6-yl-methyl-4-(beta-D-ribofuranosyl)aminobenzene 5'-phosphate synthase